jgi:uncharacterized UPF0160 family protein
MHIPIDVNTIIGFVVIPIIAYFFKSTFQRLANLENKMESTVSESRVRQLMLDQILPLKEDLHEIKQKIDRIFEYYVTQIKQGGQHV